jgi:hypothetical protein
VQSDRENLSYTIFFKDASSWEIPWHVLLITPVDILLIPAIIPVFIPENRIYTDLWKTPGSGQFTKQILMPGTWSIPSPIRAPSGCSGRPFSTNSAKNSTIVLGSPRI